MNSHQPLAQKVGNRKLIIISCTLLLFVIIATFFTIKSALSTHNEGKLGTIRIWYTEVSANAIPRADGSISDDNLISQGKISELILLQSGYDELKSVIGKENYAALILNKKEDRFGEPIVDWGEAIEGRYMMIDGQHGASFAFDSLCPHMRFVNLNEEVCEFGKNRVSAGIVQARDGGKPLIAKLRIMNLA